MKNSLKGLFLVMSIVALAGCGAKTEQPNTPTPSEPVDVTPTQTAEVTQPVEETTPAPEENPVAEENAFTQAMALEGVNNYINSIFGENISKENRDLMFVSNGDETNTEYEIVFRSYTGAYQYFYVDKATGTTRIVEKNPIDNTKTETGTISISDYLNKE